MGTNLTGTWTDERTELFKKRFADGISFGTIAAELGISRNAVIGKAHRLLLPRRGNSRSNQHGDYIQKPKRKHTTRNANNLRLFSLLARGQETVELPPEVITNPVTLLDLEPHHCRWPVSDPVMYCGADKQDGFFYCPKHCSMAYQKPRARGDNSRLRNWKYKSGKLGLAIITVADGEEAA